MDALADTLRGLAIVEGPNITDEAVILCAKSFVSKRVFLVELRNECQKLGQAAKLIAAVALGQ
ncbi:hypothetical protein HX792_06925 [Pseudomonas sp. B6002]|nr:hypothetical protein [Pseudomonas sp. B6002]